MRSCTSNKVFLIFLTYMNNHGPVGFAIKSKRLHRANKAPWHVMMITNSCPGLVFPKQCLQCDHRGSLLSPPDIGCDNARRTILTVQIGMSLKSLFPSYAKREKDFNANKTAVY